jgi:hypothetical protein
MVSDSSAPALNPQQDSCFARQAAGVNVLLMRNGDRKSKVTPETQEESNRLRELWDSRPHPGQAEFGEKFGIGNQSAVSQFLRGAVPLSLNAAAGFAHGLGCRVEDFSPRLAAEAAAIGTLAPGAALTPELVELAKQVSELPPKHRKVALSQFRQIVELLRETLQATGDSLSSNTDVDDGQSRTSPKRTSNG